MSTIEKQTKHENGKAGEASAEGKAAAARTLDVALARITECCRDVAEGLPHTKLLSVAAGVNEDDVPGGIMALIELNTGHLFGASFVDTAPFTSDRRLELQIAFTLAVAEGLKREPDEQTDELTLELGLSRVAEQIARSGAMGVTICAVDVQQVEPGVLTASVELSNAALYTASFVDGSEAWNPDRQVHLLLMFGLAAALGLKGQAIDA